MSISRNVYSKKHLKLKLIERENWKLREFNFLIEDKILNQGKKRKLNWMKKWEIELKLKFWANSGTIIPASNHTLWKRRGRESNEGQAYAKLMNDICSPLVPKFFREVEHNGDFFIEIEDLTHQFDDPAIMDVKMGTRLVLILLVLICVPQSLFCLILFMSFSRGTVPFSHQSGIRSQKIFSNFSTFIPNVV